MPIISIGGNDYPVYVTVADATVYLTPDIQYGALWTGTPVATQESAIVSATYWLDRKEYNQEFTHDNAPPEMAAANSVLAVMLVEDPTLASNAASDASNISSVGSAAGESVSFFGREKGQDFPARVQEILRDLLGSGTAGSLVFGAWDGSGCQQYDTTLAVCRDSRCC